MPVRPPLHRSVADDLRRRIQTGELVKGSRLPREEEMAEQLRIGRSTLREALRALEQEGLIIRRHGVGSFVAPNAELVRDNMASLELVAENIRRAGHTATIETLEVKLGVPNEKTREALNLTPGTQAWHVTQRFFLNGRPVIYSRTALSPGLTEKMPSPDDVPLRKYLEKERGIKIQSMVVSVHATALTPDVAVLMEVPPGTPMLLLKGPALNEQGDAVYYTESVYNSEVYQFQVIRR